MITPNAVNGYLPLFTLPSIIHPLFAPLPTPPKKMDQSVDLKDVPAMDEVEFKQNCRLSRAAGHFPPKVLNSAVKV